MEVRDKPEVDPEPVPTAEPTPGITEEEDKGAIIPQHGFLPKSNSSKVVLYFSASAMTTSAFGSSLLS